MFEAELAWQFTKYLVAEAIVEPQKSVVTVYAEKKIDIAIGLEGCRLGIMFNELGSTSARARSGFRDALLLEAGSVDVLYRFDKQDLQDRLHDCLLLVAKWNPAFFSARGLVILERLSSPEARAFLPSYNTSLMAVAPCVNGFESYSRPGLVFRRMCCVYPVAWKPDLEKALIHYGVSEDLLRQMPI